MEKFKKEIPFLLIAVLPFIYLAFIWNKLPEKVPMHWNGAGEIDDWGKKIEIIFPLLLISGIGYFTFLILPSLDPKGNLEKMGNKLQNLRYIISIFFTLLALFIVYSIQTKNANPKIIFVIIGLLFTFLGNYFKTIKPNYFIGIRTPWTLENEDIWKKTHLLGGKLWFIGGLLMAMTFVLSNKIQFYTFMGITAVISIVPIVYSYLEFKKTKNQ
jgi:uncharacterized membrane protein